LNDIDFRLKQGCADLQKGLRTLWKLDSDQIAFNDSQPGPFQYLSTSLRVAQQETHKGALGRIVDRKGHDSDSGPFKASHHLEQLANAIF